MASIANLNWLIEREEEWRRDGVIYVTNQRTGQRLPLGIELLDDVLKNCDTIERAVRSLKKPFLIVQGDADEAVGAEAAQQLSNWAPDAWLEILPGADHTFGIKHPFAESAVQFETVVMLLKDFFAILE